MALVVLLSHCTAGVQDRRLLQMAAVGAVPGLLCSCYCAILLVSRAAMQDRDCCQGQLLLREGGGVLHHSSGQGSCAGRGAVDALGRCCQQRRQMHGVQLLMAGAGAAAVC